MADIRASPSTCAVQEEAWNRGAGLPEGRDPHRTDDEEQPLDLIDLEVHPLAGCVEICHVEGFSSPDRIHNLLI